jgi:exopolysaccharide biosynthesis polyprenyl glycosylphosphotransferase
VTIARAAELAVAAERYEQARSRFAAGAAPRHRHRARKLRQGLVLADLTGLLVAYLLDLIVLGSGQGSGNRFGPISETALFLATLPFWFVLATLYGLYDRDEERAAHRTADDLVGVFHLVTVGVWINYAVLKLTGLANPDLRSAVFFWLVTIVLITLCRGLARATLRSLFDERQRTLIVGRDRFAQLVARKIGAHPEYGLELVGFAEPGDAKGDAGTADLGSASALPRLIREQGIDRVVVADAGEETPDVVHSLHALDVQIDIVLRRLADAVGPGAYIHSLEGLPMIGLPLPHLPPTARIAKRAVDIVGSFVALVLAAPVFLVVASLIKRSSPGPVFFRQVRLGMNMRPFEMFKFRTMVVDARADEHRNYIRRTMDAAADPTDEGIFKLDRSDAVTSIGRWLRRTSLDELPQLINVLRGDMSLVGPRPCLEYELEGYEPHHYDRFLVPAGMTGLWQVTARAKASYGEALEMDVAYARSRSLGLDLLLLVRTPFEVLRAGATR